MIALYRSLNRNRIEGLLSFQECGRWLSFTRVGTRVSLELLVIPLLLKSGLRSFVCRINLQ